MEFGCGKCYPCKVNRRRMWTGRIMLEAGCHEFNTFGTLTYKNAPAELVPADLVNFWRRLKRIAPRPLRYYGVGEYGEQSFRPHFHLAIFGLSPLERSYLEDAWSVGGESLGFVDAGDLNKDSAAYIAGYVCKKIGTWNHPALEGKSPEFSRMSRHPGIGALAVDSISLELVKKGAAAALADALDVPAEMRFQNRRFPVGQYIRGKMREAVGWDKRMPREKLAQVMKEKLLEDKDRLARKREAVYRSVQSRLAIERGKKKL